MCRVAGGQQAVLGTKSETKDHPVGRGRSSVQQEGEQNSPGRLIPFWNFGVTLDVSIRIATD